MKNSYYLRPGIPLFLAITFSLILLPLSGQRTYPPDISCDKVVSYKSASGVDLQLWIFNPPNHSIENEVPAIVFFFGGGWNGGSPEQFVKQCEYLAGRGMVSMVADYRVASRNDVRVDACVADAKSAVRWIRENADILGVDPVRIAAGGGSAGGHLAAATALLPEFDEPSENLEISSRPNALALFNPALVLAPLGEENPQQEERLKNLLKRLGAEPEKLSPYHHVSKGSAPCIIFHGTADKTVPFESVELFRDKMKESGNTCILAAYENEGHGFFNYGRKDNEAYYSTVSVMDDFFVDLGWLSALPDPILE